MSHSMQVLLTGVFTLASCVWVGGYVAIAIVARVASRTLEPAQRVAFFRGLGRSYLLVGMPALAVALGTGAGLASKSDWDATLIATAVLAAALVAALAAGVAQARRMTRLRAASLAAPERLELKRRIVQGARAATTLRAAIGLLSLALLVFGSILAT